MVLVMIAKYISYVSHDLRPPNYARCMLRPDAQHSFEVICRLVSLTEGTCVPVKLFKMHH